MMKNITIIWPFIFLIIVVLMRVAMEKMIRVSNIRKQFIWTGILFGLYTILLLFFVCSAYYNLTQNGSSIAEYHRAIVYLILIMAGVMLFTGVICYVRMGKRRLSDADKMKLRDM